MSKKQPWPIAWLLGTKSPVSPALRAQLEAGLFTSVPIFLGGVLNSVAVASIAAWRQPDSSFRAWLLFEIGLALVRLCVLLTGLRALRHGREPPVSLACILSCAWAASIGYGAFISIGSGDWVLATIVCLSTAAMVCGICLRNFGTPRLAATMVILSLTPCAVAGGLASESIVRIIAVQLPVYILTILSAAFYLHGLMVSRMTALVNLKESELFNRTILESSPDYTLILDAQHRVAFFNQPTGRADTSEVGIGTDWLELLPPQDHDAGLAALATATAGMSGNLVTSHTDENGSKRWFDVIVRRIADDTGRLIVVARDITHQKGTEEQALWMARHDALTELPNRAVLHDNLDAVLLDGDPRVTHALLIVDVDNFKTINDTLGHDAGDALLCIFAERLRDAVDTSDLVARTGGDEFALLVSANCEDVVHSVAQRIYEALKRPFIHQGRLLHCGASIGASLLPLHGSSRSEIMKAADIALYAAKADGRGRLKIFEQSMKVQVERRQAMIGAARRALELDRVAPFYQPKICLRTSRIVGFEALLRWTDESGKIRGPDDLMAAFEDPELAAALSDRMFDRTLRDLCHWLEIGIEVGHVAINVTAAEFRQQRFAEDLLARLAAKSIPPAHLHIEVTETVFLGRGAGYVEETLRTLSEHGVRIALDDFGTGYASLSHLTQFPIDLLKIDRSFVHQLGRSGDADAICAAVIHLGHCLGMEIVAEGVETTAQEAQLASLGCDTAQGFLYSIAVPASDVPTAVKGWDKPRRVARSI